jgi:hypothetical protein
MSDVEWQAWERQYWRDEKQRAKNEKFLSIVSAYVDRASEVLHTVKGLRTPADDGRSQEPTTRQAIQEQGSSIQLRVLRARDFGRRTPRLANSLGQQRSYRSQFIPVR